MKKTMNVLKIPALMALGGLSTYLYLNNSKHKKTSSKKVD